MAKTSAQLRAERPKLLTIYWCDRCGHAINQNEDRDHHHAEQCGCCLKWKPVGDDMGYCRSHESVYGGRQMFEHDTCSKWIKGEW